MEREEIHMMIFLFFFQFLSSLNENLIKSGIDISDDKDYQLAISILNPMFAEYGGTGKLSC